MLGAADLSGKGDLTIGCRPHRCTRGGAVVDAAVARVPVVFRLAEVVGDRRVDRRPVVDPSVVGGSLRRGRGGSRDNENGEGKKTAHRHP